jgi:hypothetical protein
MTERPVARPVCRHVCHSSCDSVASEVAGLAVVGGSDVRWKIFPYGKFSAIFFQKIFRFLKSSLNNSFFNLFLVALGLRGCYTY